MKNIREKLHISTIDGNAGGLARAHGLGIECAEFCWAHYLDCEREKHLAAAKQAADGIGSLWFHAPFAEISPCAIDPRVRELTALRYRQSAEAAAELGIRRLVIHGGYIPYVYFPESFVAESVRFWKEFLRDAPGDIVIALENVMEPSPDMLVEIVRETGDERLGLCLDVGHANCGYSEKPPLDWIAPMSPYLRHVHLHNNHGEKDEHLPLGNGSIPMEAVMERIRALCPGADFTIENMDSRDSVAWLKEKGFIDD
ncbi:MAG: sugar phosphate isomerase/epimerase [Clostridia bacterium]|nr:sugar phosphate isomerase/epimerase [Clostridia bacterium]